MEFENCDSNADKVKLYESVRKRLGEIYEDEPDEFGPASVSENPYKDLDDVNEFDLREYQRESKDRKGTNTKRIFSCPRESKEFEAEIFFLLEAIIFEIFHIIAIFFNSG